MKKRGMISLFLVMMSLWAYSQRILEENEFPVKVKYQNVDRVLITLSQVDSLNIAFSNLQQCSEYKDSLVSNLSSAYNIIHKGTEVIAHQDSLIIQKEKIIVEHTSLMNTLIEDNTLKAKRLQRSQKIVKILTITSAILLLIVLI